MPKCGTAADIGSDHGLLACRLIETGRARRVVAVENRPGPYERTLASVLSRLGPDAPVAVRLGDGLEPIAPGEVEVAILAGMGGLTLIDILRRGADRLGAGTLVVAQPMRDTALLRRWWRESGWRVVDEALVRDRGRLYEVTAAVHPGPSRRLPDVPGVPPGETDGALGPPDRPGEPGRIGHAHGREIRAVPVSEASGPGAAPPLSLPLRAVDRYGPLLLARRDPLLWDRLKTDERKCLRICRQVGGDRGSESAREAMEMLADVEEVRRWLQSAM